MKVLTNKEIGLLRCAQRPGQTGISWEAKAGGRLLDPFMLLLFGGYLEQPEDPSHFVLTPEGEDALYAATRYVGEQ